MTEFDDRAVRWINTRHSIPRVCTTTITGYQTAKTNNIISGINKHSLVIAVSGVYNIQCVDSRQSSLIRTSARSPLYKEVPYALAKIR